MQTLKFRLFTSNQHLLYPWYLFVHEEKIKIDEIGDFYFQLPHHDTFYGKENFTLLENQQLTNLMNHYFNNSTPDDCEITIENLASNYNIKIQEDFKYPATKIYKLRDYIFITAMDANAYYEVFEETDFKNHFLSIIKLKYGITKTSTLNQN